MYRRPDAAEMANNLGHITLMAYKHLQDALSAGITTLRGVGEPKGLGEAIRAGYHKGYIKGPRYYTCERSITITGGHGSTGEITKLEVDGPWNARQAVRQNIKEGADWIKVMDSHRSESSEFTLEELCAITDEAHRLGKKCCIHAGTVQSIEFALKAGFDSLEHAAFLTESLAEEAISKNTAWVPTVYVYQTAVEYMRKVCANPTQRDLDDIKFLEETVEGYNQNLLRNYQKGVLIATGTDICFPEMFITPIQDEIEALCGLGLTNLQAIECATGNGAKLLGAEGCFGTIRNGLCADLLVVKGDPSADISALRDVCEVYVNGELLYCAADDRAGNGRD
jgi:imidazolonepropionase-like amidohydrolase